MNKTGVRPVEYKILIQVDLVEEKIGRILIPETAREREQTAHDRGILVDAGDMAFSDWHGNKPKIGDKIIFNKYAGTIIQFREERELMKFRLCNDKDICAILEEEDG
jgi:co-chaperonin GroES (HSP10)